VTRMRRRRQVARRLETRTLLSIPTAVTSCARREKRLDRLRRRGAALPATRILAIREDSTDKRSILFPLIPSMFSHISLHAVLFLFTAARVCRQGYGRKGSLLSVVERDDPGRSRGWHRIGAGKERRPSAEAIEEFLERLQRRQRRGIERWCPSAKAFALWRGGACRSYENACHPPSTRSRCVARSLPRSAAALLVASLRHDSISTKTRSRRQSHAVGKRRRER